MWLHVLLHREQPYNIKPIIMALQQVKLQKLNKYGIKYWC